jgi:hypothetical protein
MFRFSTIPSRTLFSAMLNSVADSASPCLTPVDTLKGLLVYLNSVIVDLHLQGASL